MTQDFGRRIKMEPEEPTDEQIQAAHDEFLAINQDVIETEGVYE